MTLDEPKSENSKSAKVVTKDYIGVQDYGDMKQKADKGIEKIEKEEKQLARVLKIVNALITQRVLRGRWK